MREYEQFASVYCGLCHTLKKRYGYIARYMLNYDITFLVMLLAGAESGIRTEYHRCTASPIRKKCCRYVEGASETAADLCVILTYWKIRDGIKDEGVMKGIYLRVAAKMLRGWYRRAKGQHRGFAETVEEKLLELARIEEEQTASIDIPADKFAGILERAGKEETTESGEIVGKILYHIGRIIYILDACDDLADDYPAGRYNPLVERFGLREGRLAEGEKEYIKTTLRLSAGIATADFELLPKGEYSGIIANILYEGIPRVIEEVMNGEWRSSRKKRKADKEGEKSGTKKEEKKEWRSG